ncbi:MAG: HepT-like ribonuclease domain-containing protein [Geminicoccaceae bacterium]
MPFADPRARLEHILEAIREIEGFASGRTLQDYLSQGWLRFATQRGIEIVSEASRRIADDLRAKHAEIPWTDIAGIGNILRHGYDSLDHAVIWGVVENDLPPLKAAVEAMLKEIDRNQPDAT